MSEVHSIRVKINTIAVQSLCGRNSDIRLDPKIEKRYT